MKIDLNRNRRIGLAILVASQVIFILWLAFQRPLPSWAYALWFACLAISAVFGFVGRREEKRTHAAS